MGKKENHEKHTFGSWLTTALVCFQAPRTAPATFVAVSFDVLCGGGLGKQRTAQPQRRKQRAWQELFLLRNHSAPAIYVEVVEVRCEGSKGEWHEGSRGCEHELFFFFSSHSISLSDGPDVANIYWLA